MTVEDDSGSPKGLPLALDPQAKSASSTEPAFIARPNGAPVYYGFKVLEDVVVEGFTFGTITDFELEPADEGDAFVIAPDGSRAGIVWQISPESNFEQIIPFEANRWGVYSVAFAHPMRNREGARLNLKSLVSQLRTKWEEWKANYP
jgi:hypothetical protein